MHIIIAILIFGFIIIFHELGHFLTAKACNVRVNEFTLGLGPTLVSFGKGETKYCLKLLPFGGSCVAERNKDFPLLKRQLIDEINALGLRELAVADLNLELFSGEIHGLIGENGSGKSTFSSMLCGIHTISSGTLTLLGKEIKTHYYSPQVILKNLLKNNSSLQ